MKEMPSATSSKLLGEHWLFDETGNLDRYEVHGADGAGEQMRCFALRKWIFKGLEERRLREKRMMTNFL